MWNTAYSACNGSTVKCWSVSLIEILNSAELNHQVSQWPSKWNLLSWRTRGQPLLLFSGHHPQHASFPIQILTLLTSSMLSGDSFHSFWMERDGSLLNSGGRPPGQTLVQNPTPGFLPRPVLKGQWGNAVACNVSWFPHRFSGACLQPTGLEGCARD